MLPHHRRASGFTGVRPRPNGTFYAELCAGGYWLTLGTYNMTNWRRGASAARGAT
jgi:hypothetical protein